MKDTDVYLGSCSYDFNPLNVGFVTKIDNEDHCLVTPYLLSITTWVFEILEEYKGDGDGAASTEALHNTHPDDVNTSYQSFSDYYAYLSAAPSVANSVIPSSTPEVTVTCEIAPVTTPIASSLHEYTSGDSGLDISLSQTNAKFELIGASATCGPIIFDVECAVKAQIIWVPSWCSYDELKEEFTLKTP